MTGPSLYTLTDLLACLKCPEQTPMVPTVRTSRRYQCPKCLIEVDAEFAETTVWERVRRLRPALAPAATPLEDRNAVMRGIVRMLAFAPWSGTFRITWLPHATLRACSATGAHGD